LSGSNPSYEYVDKTGPKQMKYNFSDGGVRVYKEPSQKDNSGAQMSSPYEELCTPRN
jgi:hypothetical protein